MKRKPLNTIFGLAALGLFLVLAAWLLLQSAFVVNRLAGLLEPLTGYRVSVEGIRISPALHATVRGLRVAATSGEGPTVYVARAEVDAAIKNVVQAEVERLVLTGPKLFFRLPRELVNYASIWPRCRCLKSAKAGVKPTPMSAKPLIFSNTTVARCCVWVSPSAWGMCQGNSAISFMNQGAWPWSLLPGIFPWPFPWG